MLGKLARLSLVSSSVLRFLISKFIDLAVCMEDLGQTFVLTVRNLALSVSKLIPKRLILGLTGHCTLQIEMNNS